MSCSKSYSKQFEEWYDTTFLFSRQAASPLLISESKTMKARFIRIKEVAIILIESKGKSIQVVREEIAMKYFVSMRCSLDYIHYAQFVLVQFINRKI